MAKRYHLTQQDRDLIGRTIKTVQGMGRGERPLPRRPRRPMGDTEETFRLIRGESVGVQSGATILIDNVVVLSGGIDPSGGNPATQIRVANLFGQSFTDNEKVQAIYSPAVVASPLTDWEAVKTISGTETYRLIRGLAKGAVDTTDTTFVIDNVIALAGGLDPTSGNPATEITVHNIFSDSYADNEIVIAIYNLDDDQWEALRKAGGVSKLFAIVEDTGGVPAATGIHSGNIDPGLGTVRLYNFAATAGAAATQGATVSAENYMFGDIENHKPIFVFERAPGIYVIDSEGCAAVPGA